MDIHTLHKKFVNECNQLVCTDSRKIIPEAIFFALRGDSFNGNDFAARALDLGCRYAIVDDQKHLESEHCIFVSDVTETLQQLANYHRREFNVPVIGLTGSNGKTTTKELMVAALSEQKKVTATKENFNNHIGVPLTLLAITKETQIVIVEMGANHRGEIKLLCEIAEPTYGVITNIGRAHLGKFGGMGGVIQAKIELYEYLRAHEGHVFVNGSDELLLKYSQGMDRTLYGPDVQGVFMVKSKHTLPYLSVTWDHAGDIETHLTGEYNLDNIACAIATAVHFDVLNKTIKQGLQRYEPKNNRSEMISTDHGNYVIKDFYNANGSSMEAALRNAKDVSKEKKLILILGDMFELGEYSHDEHQNIANLAASLDPDFLFLIGEEFAQVHTDKGRQFKTTQEAILHLEKESFKQSVILIKGSNGMNFQSLFDQIDW